MQQRQPRAALFGAADVSGADGQHFVTAGQAEALGAHNAHIAPSGWQHINLTGDYLWGACGSLGPDGLRPLRNLETPTSTSLAA